LKAEDTQMKKINKRNNKFASSLIDSFTNFKGKIMETAGQKLLNDKIAAFRNSKHEQYGNLGSSPVEEEGEENNGEWAERLEEDDWFFGQVFDVFSSLIKRPGEIAQNLAQKEDDHIVIGCVDLCEAQEAGSIILNVQAFVAIVSSILFWVGSQDILVDAFDPSLTRELAFSGIGLVLVFVTDTV
jgi:hypothetical protein